MEAVSEQKVTAYNITLICPHRFPRAFCSDQVCWFGFFFLVVHWDLF